MLKLEYIISTQGKSQTDIARDSGINRVTINRILRGWEIPTERAAQAIARAAGWPIERAAELFEEITEVR